MKAKEIKQRFREWRTVRTKKNLNRVVPFWKTFWILFGCLFLLHACTGIWSLVSEYRNTFPALEEEYQDNVESLEYEIYMGMTNRMIGGPQNTECSELSLQQSLASHLEYFVFDDVPNFWWGLYDLQDRQLIFEKDEEVFFFEIYYRVENEEETDLYEEVFYRVDSRQNALINKYSYWMEISEALLKGDEVIILSYIVDGEEYDAINPEDFPELKQSSNGEVLYTEEGYRLVRFEENTTLDWCYSESRYGWDGEAEVAIPLLYPFVEIGGISTEASVRNAALKKLDTLAKTGVQFNEEYDIVYEDERVGLFHKQYSAAFSATDYTNDKSYICYVMYNFREEENQFIKKCIQTGLVMFLFPLCIGLIVSYILHRRSKMNHAVYTYRSTLNNAMAHDLKTPLMAISGYAENVVEGTNPEKRDYYVSEMSKQVSYMKNMIEGIQSLANSEDGNEEKSVRIDLKSLTEEVLQGLESEITEGKYAFSISGDCNLKSMRTSMETLVRNLIENACKYAPEGDAVAIKLERKTFTISNSLVKQITVKPDKLLEPFTKGDTSRSGRKGTGLGLAIVKSICDRYGYRVGINTDDGRFTVRIHF